MPVVPGAPSTGAPEATLSRNRFWPMGSRPAGLTKLASSIWPTCCGWVWPGSLTVTMPSLETVTLSVSAGSVMPAVSGKPLLVTMRPCASRWKLPSRV